jgi:hypothetical protein
MRPAKNKRFQMLFMKNCPRLKGSLRFFNRKRLKSKLNKSISMSNSLC